MTGRLPSGSDRLDEVLGGGLPTSAINLVIGPPGSGKTILAEQYLFHNATEQRPGVFLSTVSEPFEKVLRYGASLDFFDADAIGTRVFYADLGTALANDGIKGLVDEVDGHLKEFQPGILVIDGFKAISGFAADEAEYRRFLHDLAGRLTAVSANAFWIGKYRPRATTEPAEFAVTDSIISMGTKRAAERETSVLQVLKLRGSSFRPGEHTYRITQSGIDVFPRLAAVGESAECAGGTTRSSTGIPALDTALGDGYWEGSSTLVTGPTGVGKTLMGLHFAFNAAREGRPAIFATFQENATQLGRIAAGFGWAFDDPCISVLRRSPVDLYIEEWAHDLLDLIDTVGASRVVIDSLGEILLASPDEARFRELVHALVQRCTRRRVSLLFTYEVAELFDATRLPDVAVANPSDNVVVLQYFRTGSQVRRSLTVLKTRGSDHTHEVRELHIGADGLTLGDPVDTSRHA
jgi:circadian clock protein KaiC